MTASTAALGLIGALAAPSLHAGFGDAVGLASVAPGLALELVSMAMQTTPSGLPQQFVYCFCRRADRQAADRCCCQRPAINCR